MKRTWVVLGQGGFLGRHLMRQLEGRGDVRGFGRPTLDLRRRETLSLLDPHMGPNTVVIFASCLTPEHCKEPGGVTDNVAMAANVASYLEKHPVERLAYVSSDAVYPLIDAAITEATPLNADNYYALSKLASERLLQLASCAKRWPLLIARPSGIYGPGDTHNAYGPNRFVSSIVAERTLRMFGEGEETRDHVYVDDVCRVVAELVESGASGAFNVVTGRAVPFGTIVSILKELARFEFRVESQPRKGAITHRTFDPAKLRAELPNFKFTELRDGLKSLLNAVLAEKKS